MWPSKIKNMGEESSKIKGGGHKMAAMMCFIAITSWPPPLTSQHQSFAV